MFYVPLYDVCINYFYIYFLWYMNVYLHSGIEYLDNIPNIFPIIITATQFFNPIYPLESIFKTLLVFLM